MADITRIHPDALSGLMSWIKENFDSIDQFVVSFTLDDRTIHTSYDTYSFVEAMGITAVAHATINKLGEDGEFVKKITPRKPKKEGIQ